MSDKPDIYLSEEEIITDMLLYRLAEREKVALRNVPPNEIKELCSELSGALIEHYRLNDDNNPYTDQNAIADNTAVNVSYRIVEKLWSRLTGKTIPTPTSEIVDNGDGTYLLNGAIVYSAAIGA